MHLNRENCRDDRRRPLGRDESERTMRPMFVVVPNIDSKNALEMAATDDQEVIEAVAANGAGPTAPRRRSRSAPVVRGFLCI